MNLQPLYDLKERLEYIAIAGIGFIQEDFRLKRVVDGLAPLALASPVFAKINASANALLEAPQEERSTRLLDVLSLVDAVVYTQGVTNVNGDIIPITKKSGNYICASYGQLQPLILALSTTGSGRMSIVEGCWKEHPEYFMDFRVLPYVMKALSDNYSELADLAFTILSSQGVDIVPILKEGFNPAGKREMVQRAHLVATLAGKVENDWFVSILPEAKKEVREVVIRALGMCQDNAQLLLDLCQSERGKAKEAAWQSLCYMEDVSCAEHWKKEIKKKPGSIACLEGVNTPVAADMTAFVLRELLEKIHFVCNEEQADKLWQYSNVARGKYSEEMSHLWNWIASEMPAFAKIYPEKKAKNSGFCVAEQLQKCMMQTVLWNPCREVLELAKSLAKSCKEWFLCCGFLADLIEQPAEYVFDTYSPYMMVDANSKKEMLQEKNNRLQIMEVLSLIKWDGEKQCYFLSFTKNDLITERMIYSAIYFNKIDFRWIQLLTDKKFLKKEQVVGFDSIWYTWSIETKKVSAEDILINVINPQDASACAVIGDYLYKRILQTGKINSYIDKLLRCGWTNWKGLLAHCAEKNGEVGFYLTKHVLSKLPITNVERAEELKQLDELVRSEKVKIAKHSWARNNWSSEKIQEIITKLETDPHMEIDMEVI